MSRALCAWGSRSRPWPGRSAADRGAIRAPTRLRAGAPGSGLRGKILFPRFLNDADSHGALFVMNADRTDGAGIGRLPAHHLALRIQPDEESQ